MPRRRAESVLRDERGKTQPEDATWNDLGYLNGVAVVHPVEVG